MLTKIRPAGPSVVQVLVINETVVRLGRNTNYHTIPSHFLTIMSPGVVYCIGRFRTSVWSLKLFLRNNESNGCANADFLAQQTVCEYLWQMSRAVSNPAAITLQLAFSKASLSAVPAHGLFSCRIVTRRKSTVPLCVCCDLAVVGFRSYLHS